MKKVISLVLTAILAASVFTGCASQGTPSTSGTTSSNATTASSDATSSAPAATDSGITKAEDLNGLVIGCQAGTTGEGWVTENCPKKAPRSYKSGMDAALDLKNGKIDAIVFDELPAKQIVEKNPDLKILDIKFAKEAYAIAVAKGNTQLVETINATIKRMKDDGSYKTLTDAFMPADGKIVLPADVTPSAGGATLRMGTNAAFAPFEYVEGDKIVGFDISMAQNIAKDSRADLEVNDMAFESLIAALQSGTIDFVAAGMSVTPEREKNVDFSDAYYESEQVIIVKK